MPGAWEPEFFGLTPEARSAIQRLGRHLGVHFSDGAGARALDEYFSPEPGASYCVGVIALLLAAAAVGLSNLAASVGIGVAGVNARVRLRVGVVFGVFEAGMPVLGLLIGQGLATEVGRVVRWPGAILLMLVGVLGVLRSLKARSASPPPADEPATAPTLIPRRGTVRLLASGLVLSMDNLVVGFALGTYGVGILVGAIVIGAVSVVMSLAGLELGGLLGRWAGRRGDQMSGAVLILVGAAIAGGAFG
jgi:putative Mn2+ efflux pump MntP